mgnify:CR=1 FL=1
MKISSIKNLEKLSNKIKNKISIGDTILLYGEIGVGKTTFARLFINNLEKYNKLKKKKLVKITKRSLEIVIESAKAVKKMAAIDKMKEDGTISTLSKRERLQIDRQRAKLELNL